MIASPGTTCPTNSPPVTPLPAVNRIPPWEQIPQDKRQELTQVLADMLIHKLQSLEMERAHEPPP